MAALAEPDTSSPIVAEAQKLLNKSLQQSRVKEDGAFDPHTVDALKEFQKESGLPVTGELDKKTMDILKDVASQTRPKYQVTVNGKVYLLTDADHKALVNRLKSEFRPAVQQLKSAAAEARGYFDHMKELNKKHYVVSFMIEAVKGASMPSESLIRAGETGADTVESMLNAGNLKGFAAAFPKAQDQVNKARSEIKTYVADMIDGGGNLATGLEIVKTTSFIVVGIIAAPVAASYGLGAVAAGAVAGAGTNAVETLAEEVGKGIAGDSKGVGDAAKNVLLDAFIGGSIGALVKGKAAEKIIEGVGAKVAEKLGGELFEKASKAAVSNFVGAYFKKNGADILEGIMKETLKTFRGNAEGLTVEKFIGIVAKEVLTAGVFSKFVKSGDLSATDVLKQIPMKQRVAWIEELGEKATAEDVQKLFAKAFEDSYKEWAGKVYDAALDKAKGEVDPAALKDMIIKAAAEQKALIAATMKAVQREGKKKK